VRRDATWSRHFCVIPQSISRSYRRGDNQVRIPFGKDERYQETRIETNQKPKRRRDDSDGWS
jgi:hypothetical protein